MSASPLTARSLFHLGPVPVTAEVVTTWGLIAVLAIGAGAGDAPARRWSPGPARRSWSSWSSAFEDQIREALQRRPAPLLPFLGTPLPLPRVANLSSLVPGVKPPTAHLETPPRSP